MTVRTVNHVEDCLDGTAIKELILGEPANRALADRLSALGELDYYDNFPRPFFRVTSDAVQIKGVAGSHRIRLWLSSAADNATVDAVVRLAEDGDSTVS